MQAWWHDRSVTRRPETIELPGRVLWLVDDAEAMRSQLTGRDLETSGSHPLRDDISTDEITPARVCYHFDRTLGSFAYLGLTAGGVQPVREGEVRAGGFVASVAGRRRGKGSSREAAPFAESAAGIQVALAASFERIYETNCVNLGILTSTDLDLADTLLQRHRLPLSAFHEGRDPITAEVVAFGGLFPYNVARLQGRTPLPSLSSPQRPMTLTEKILAAHWRRQTGPCGVPAVAPGDAGFVAVDLRFSHEYVTPMAAAFWSAHVGADVAITEPGTVLLFRDHLALLGSALPDSPSAERTLRQADRLATIQRQFAALHGIGLHEADSAGGGICHTVVLQRYALPGQVILGTDSHTCQAGAIGALGIGCGTTEMFNAWFTRDARITVPPTIRIELEGRLPADVAAKDIMLQLLSEPRVRRGGALGAVLEFAGGTVGSLSIDERATLTNMTAEAGGFTGLVAPDQTVVDFLADRGCDSAAAASSIEGLTSDRDAEYAEVIRLNVADLEPLVSPPFDPGNGRPVRDVEGLPIDIAYVGSCTGGKRDDIEMVAHVLRWAASHSLRVHPRARCFIQFGSAAIFSWARGSGCTELFERVGAILLPPGCGACINAGPGVSHRPDEVTISSINRNFPGRSGPGKVFLASPATVAASAVAGEIISWPQLRHRMETTASTIRDTGAP